MIGPCVACPEYMLLTKRPPRGLHAVQCHTAWPCLTLVTLTHLSLIAVALTCQCDDWPLCRMPRVHAPDQETSTRIACSAVPSSHSIFKAVQAGLCCSFIVFLGDHGTLLLWNPQEPMGLACFWQISCPVRCGGFQRADDFSACRYNLADDIMLLSEGMRFFYHAFNASSMSLVPFGLFSIADLWQCPLLSSLAQTGHSQRHILLSHAWRNGHQTAQHPIWLLRSMEIQGHSA